MNKILSTYFPPISDCYSACSGVASILQAYDPYNPALFLNRLYFFRKSNNILKFATLEKTNKICIYTCENRDIVDFLLECLNNNDYVFLNLDHFYIKASDHFQSHHFLHDVTLIYGYDLDKKIFYCADNFIDGKYLQKKVSFNEIKEAHIAAVNSGKENIIVFHYGDNMCNKILDFNKINIVLQDYVNSEYENLLKINPTFLTDNIFGVSNGQSCTFETCIFGIKIYDWLLEYLRSAEIDLRPLQLLVNHQNILYAMIICMQRYANRCNVQKYTDILKEQVNDSIIARNLAIKYDVSQEKDVHKQVINVVKQVYNREQFFFNDFLADTLIWHARGICLDRRIPDGKLGE